MVSDPRADTDTRALERELRRHVRGAVRFDAGSRALWATDASNYRQVPIGVVLPLDSDDVEAAVQVAHRHDVPLLPRGGGTSLAGQCCNVALVIDTSKHCTRILELDAARRSARAESGVILDSLRAAAEQHGLTYGPDPATHDRCTLGGMLGNNSCGVHAVMSEFYGPGPTTAHQVKELEILTHDGARFQLRGETPPEKLAQIVRAGGRCGEIHAALAALRDRYADEIRRRFPAIPRCVSGYNLPALLPENGFNVARALVGSEGTCAIVLDATLTLIETQPCRALVVLGYPSIYEAGDHVAAIRELGPIGLEGIDDRLIEFVRRKVAASPTQRANLELLPEGGGFLLVEFGGRTPEEAEARARECVETVGRGDKGPHAALHTDAAAQHALWQIRESALGATAYVPGEPDSWPGWEDSAVAPEKIGAYLRDLRQLFGRYGYEPSLYGHLGQGCVHCRVAFDLVTPQGIETYRAFTRDAAELVAVRYGGSLSGEHGDGQARGDLLEVMFGQELVQAFRTFKEIWDPGNRMNPGKLIDARPRTESLRLGSDYLLAEPFTHFQFPEDGGSFAHATLRCVGIGACRRQDGGVMCPSYQVLREEEHCTRGRAHLLFEMLRGDIVRDRWQSEAVHEALDLCLACKGCKGECPVNVDVATYKAEFLAHYYERRWRPRAAHAFGKVHRWARWASHAPRLVNWTAQAPGLGALGKWLAGMARERSAPRFARESFTHWVARRPPSTVEGPAVVLWPDTFNNYFHPETARAAVEVLEHAGFRVCVPRERVCCGRPLYDYGLLDEAKHLLRRSLAVLGPQLEAGIPVVGLEPSCVAVFRDELGGLLPQDVEAQRLARQTFLLSELLAQRAPRSDGLRLAGRALVHLHCHQRAVLGVDAELDLLRGLGLDCRIPDTGCCGMAGSFGFEADKYALSQRIGERKLLPAVREAAEDTVLIASGFSCRTQIEQATGRRTQHLADVLQRALATPGARRQRSEPRA